MVDNTESTESTEPIVSENNKLVLNTIDDLIGAFLWYDRKEDEDLPRGVIEEMVASGEITQEEMIARFTSSLKEGLE